MNSLALFLDKRDAFACVPTIGNSGVNKEFSSFFEALMYMAETSSNTTRPSTHETTSQGTLNLNAVKEEEPMEKFNATKIGASNEASNTNVIAAAAQTNNEPSVDNNKKHDLPPDSVTGDGSQPSPKRFKSEDDAIENASLDTPDKFTDSDGNKTHPNSRLKDALWAQRFKELAVLWNGDTTVYQQHISPNRSLTNWVKHQRKLFKRGSVSEERMRKLESIGFKWVGKNSVVLSKEPQDEWELAAGKQAFSINVAKRKQQTEDGNDAWSVLWDTRFQELVEYKKHFGHTKVPKEWPKNKKLAGWVRKQREQYRKQAIGETTALTESRKKKLIDIGFVWSLRPGRLKHPLPPLPEPSTQTCIMGKEDESHDVEPYSVDKNGYLII
ncbi:MAG: hypothetical protein SGBAC_005981 [Bacillariaceae sp.]